MIQKFWQKLTTLDERSLALMRIAIGLLVIHDGIARLPSAEAFLTERGVLPLSVLPKPEIFWRAPLHSISDSEVYQYALLFLLILFAAMLTLGIRTRVVGCITWFLLSSLHERNTLILHSSDTLLRLVLFWGNFLPWGNYYSYDASKQRQFAKQPLAALGYLLQIAALYFFAALHKTGADWREDFSAVFYAVATGEFQSAAGRWLTGFPEATKLLTVLVLGIEFAAPLLLLPGCLREFVLLALFLLQVGFFIFLNLGPFPFIAVAAMLGLLPTRWWELCAAKLSGICLAKILVNRPAILLQFVPAKLEKATELPAIPLRKKIQQWLMPTLVCYCMCFVLVWNLVALPQSPYKATLFFRELARVLHLDQNWAMFAPNPPHSSSWLVSEAVLADGSTTDIWNKTALGENPTAPAMRASWGDWRWFKYLQNLRSGKYPQESRRFAEWLCHKTADARAITIIVKSRAAVNPHGTQSAVMANVTCR